MGSFKKYEMANFSHKTCKKVENVNFISKYIPIATSRIC